jgi:pimeloyl-ACP methyl ester carboxylesterase
MYYEIHDSGSGEPLVLLHGSYMTISSNWPEWIGELSKTRKVIAVEMQGHGRTADINRDFSYENLASSGPQCGLPRRQTICAGLMSALVELDRP